MSNTEKCVLIVDDEPALRDLLGELMAEEGIPFQVASDGREAFRLATRGSFALLLLDLQMPGWNGLEAIAALELVQPETRIIVQSGYVDDATRAQLDKRESVVGVFSKPFNVPEFLAFVRRQLETS